MRDITINNNESQDENQKTTPVKKSLSELSLLDEIPTNEIFHIWLGIKNDYRTLVGLDEMDIVVKDDYEDEETDDV